MNSNLKNGLATLAMVGASTLLMGGIVYGVKKGLEAEKPEAITVTDPQKAEQDIKTESDYSRVFFEATQNMQTEQAAEEEPVVADISDLCREIGGYQQRMEEIKANLKAGDRSSVRFKIDGAKRKEQEIRDALDKFGYKQPNTPNYVDKLGNEFNNYVLRSQVEISDLMKQ